MARPIGTPKTGGRQKGTPNKSTQDLQDLMNENGFNPYLRLVEVLPELDASQQAKICLDLMGYVYPKRKALDFRSSAPSEPGYKLSIETLSPEERVARIKKLIKTLKGTSNKYKDI